MQSNQTTQKSLKRRFLLILGVLVFTALVVFGLMFIFWNGLPFNMPVTQRRLFGGFIIIYALIRFPRMLRKDPNEE
jgi:membrane protease YdiL (CAAX protease family)